MIIEALLDLVFGIVNFALGLFPDSAPPSWVDDMGGYLDTIWTAGAGLGAWIPWTVVQTVFSTVLVCIGIGFTIKVVRMVLSYFLGGGGSAA